MNLSYLFLLLITSNPSWAMHALETNLPDSDETKQREFAETEKKKRPMDLDSKDWNTKDWVGIAQSIKDGRASMEQRQAFFGELIAMDSLRQQKLKKEEMDSKTPQRDREILEKNAEKFDATKEALGKLLGYEDGIGSFSIKLGTKSNEGGEGSAIWKESAFSQGGLIIGVDKEYKTAKIYDVASNKVKEFNLSLEVPAFIGSQGGKSVIITTSKSTYQPNVYLDGKKQETERYKSPISDGRSVQLKPTRPDDKFWLSYGMDRDTNQVTNVKTGQSRDRTMQVTPYISDWRPFTKPR